MLSCAFAAILLAAVSVTECPKCEKRIRIAEGGEEACINLSRLKDDSPDEATLGRRTAEMTVRAERLLKRGKVCADSDLRCPLMGWSSWNTFGQNISPEIILGTARAMATNGLKAAGYVYVNIDDGFFSGHDADGNLTFQTAKFPNGLKSTVDGIHALGLKAGIYSDAGADACGGSKGVGLYGHDEADCRLHFTETGFDFIKVDYCGGAKLKLDERKRYTEIAQAIRATGRPVRFNVCRWAFPGTWVANIAESWRTTGDIRASWPSVRGIIAENLYLSAYATPGHFNDMDMLEAGQLKGQLKTYFGKSDVGLTADEETCHFGMWCFLSSPLLLGCDVRNMPSSSLKLVTNPYLIAMNQNNGIGVQGYVVRRDGEAYVLVKDAETRFGTSRYVAIYNAEDAERDVLVESSALDLGGRIDVFDLVEKADIGVFADRIHVKVPAHGAKFFLMDAERRLERTVYEAETAFLTEYQELRDAVKAGTPFYDQAKDASGGVIVRNLGRRASNDLVWKEVRIEKGGRRTLEIRCTAPEDRFFLVEVDGKVCGKFVVKATGSAFTTVCASAELTAGLHAVRLFNPSATMPEVDVMQVR